MAYYSNKELDYDDGLIVEEIIEHDEGVSVPSAHKIGESGQFGHL